MLNLEKLSTFYKHKFILLCLTHRSYNYNIVCKLKRYKKKLTDSFAKVIQIRVLKRNASLFDWEITFIQTWIYEYNFLTLLNPKILDAQLLCSTRRSAGLPYLVVAILKSYQPIIVSNFNTNPHFDRTLEALIDCHYLDPLFEQV